MQQNKYIWIFILLLLIAHQGFSNYNQYEEAYQSFDRNDVVDYRGKGFCWFDSLNVRFVGNWPFGEPYAVVPDTCRNLIFYSCGGGVYIYDFSNPSAPIKLSEKIHTRSRFAYDLFYEMNNQRLYTAGGWDSQNEIWDVSNPSNPLKLGGWDTRFFSWEVVVADSYAYVADGMAGLRIVDVSDPANPLEVSYNNSIGYADNIAIKDSLLFVVSDSLFIFNISDPINPYIIGHYNARQNIRVIDTVAYLAGPRLTILNVSDPTNPREIGYCNVSSGELVVSDSLVYLIYTIPPNGGGLRVISIADPSNPVEIGLCDSFGRSYGLGLLNSHIFITEADSSRLNILDVTDPTHPFVENYVWAPDVAIRVNVSGSYTYISDRNGGLRIINVSDLSCPYETSYFITNDWIYDAQIKNNYVYVCCPHKGLKIVDISDPVNPVEIGGIDTPAWAYDVEIVDSIAYIADCDSITAQGSGLRIINISNPSGPYELGFYDTPGHAHEVVVKDSLAFIADANSIQIIKISNPNNPIEIGHYNCLAYSIDVENNLVYSGSSEGLRIISISNPANPVLIGIYNPAGLSIESVEINNSFAYCASWNITTGFYAVLIINVSDPSNPFEVGYYETPDNNCDVTYKEPNLYAADAYSGLQIYQSLVQPINEENSIKKYHPLILLQNPVKGDYVNLKVFLKEKEKLEIRLYNSIGQEVKKYPRIGNQKGIKKINLPLDNLPHGIYFFYIKINDITEIKKMVLL